jgi:outer membrane protein OmpA-like peptidoglycan-associated protein
VSRFPRIHLLIWLIGLVVIFLHPIRLTAQEQYSIRPLFDSNTRDSECSAGLMRGQLLVLRTSAAKNRKWTWSDLVRPGQMVAQTRGEDFFSWGEARAILPKGWKCVGPVSYSDADSTLYFSSAKNFGSARGRHVKIYSSRWDGKRWSNPSWISVADVSADNMHPFYEASRKMLVFSSDSQGGCGGMDIWYSMKSENGWAQPINPGLGVNSPADEIGPTMHGGDIFYATNSADSWGGYDIRRALGANQWRTSIAEGAPINSAADEIGIVFLSNEKAVLTSNRMGGKGGSDLFLISREPRADELHEMKLFVTCGGTALSGAEIIVRNSQGETVQSSSSDDFGRIDIQNLRLNQAYTFQLKSGGCNCLLILNDSFGNRLKEVGFDANGMAFLELLPFLFTEMRSLLVDDGSLLNVTFDGQLYQEKPGDIGRGEPITILNSAGDVVALAYTNEIGKFRFTKLDPQLAYVMRLSEQSEAKHAIITDRGRKIDIPVLNAEVEYTRLKKEEAIELVNEFNDTILISSDDLFVINRMYYAYNSAELTAESRSQLDQLAIIIERNREINLQLIAHTDSRGDEASNLDLSQRRASAAKEYLITKGISELRLNSLGLGEEQLMNECKDGVVCTEPEHAINRRTEIRLKLQNCEILSGR